VPVLVEWDGFARGSVMRATVSPPTAMHPCGVGQLNAVSGSGVYWVVDAVNTVPPSLLRATAPVPVAGEPIQFVPTTAHSSAEGQATAYMSSTGWAARDWTQVCPPSPLVSNAPWAGTTALTVVDVVPTATQELTAAHAASWTRPVPAGTDEAVHVAPPSVLIAMAPCPCPAVVGVKPVTKQATSGTHDKLPASCIPAGRRPSFCHERPKSLEWVDQNVVPSLAMAVQSLAVVHMTLVMTTAPTGIEA
jgi:hypothetical protein